MLPIVTIIGRPNVGKSTLFNRLVGEKKAVVSPTPGTTRDRHYAEIEMKKPFLLVDTGGIESQVSGEIQENVIEQAKIAIHEATVILFLFNAKENLTKEDYFIADLIRKSGKKTFIIASKSDSGHENITDFLQLGFGPAFRISAIHNQGIDELFQEIEKNIPKSLKNKKKVSDESIRLAILGRPNAGKSSLVNIFMGSQKMIVSETPGTTIDSIEWSMRYADQKFTLIDTAGIRRRGKIQKGKEKYSFLKSLLASKTADVTVLLIDGVEGITSQDQHIADYILQQGSGLIIVINKIDLFERGKEPREKIIRKLQYDFQFIPWAPVIFISAKTSKNIEKILEFAIQIKKNRLLRIETSLLNKWLKQILQKHMPSGTGRKIPKLYYMTQVRTSPPHFILFVNLREFFHFSYIRYLENELRKTFDFNGTPIRLEFRNKKDESFWR